MVRVVFYGIELDEVVVDQVTYTVSRSCSCTGDLMFTIQCSICLLLAVDMVYRMNQVLKIKSMQGDKSRSLLLATANIVNSFVLVS